MILAWLALAAGLVLLVAGGEALVRGACGVALLARVTPAVAGLTIVAAGTSMPELVVSVQAALQGSPALAVGNVVGSNIFNIAAILGIAALIRPARISGNTVRLEWPVMMLASFQLHLLARDLSIDRLEGAFLVGGLVAFLAYAVFIARRNVTPEEAAHLGTLETASFGRKGTKAWVFNVVALVLGVGLLTGGSTLLVHGAVTIARTWGVSEAVIGLTLVAAGTSLPELATSAVAAWRGNSDIAVANVIGSNIFNVLCIAGATALVHPLPVPLEIVTRDNPWMLGISLLLFPLMRSRMTVGRLEGAILLGCFTAYMGFLVRSVVA